MKKVIAAIFSMLLSVGAIAQNPLYSSGSLTADEFSPPLLNRVCDLCPMNLKSGDNVIWQPGGSIFRTIRFLILRNPVVKQHIPHDKKLFASLAGMECRFRSHYGETVRDGETGNSTWRFGGGNGKVCK